MRNHRKDKHIERKYHLIHEIVMRGDLVVEKIISTKNLEVTFMKTLSTRVFDGHRDNLGVKCFPSCFRANGSLLGLSPRKHDML